MNSARALPLPTVKSTSSTWIVPMKRSDSCSPAASVLVYVHSNAQRSLRYNRALSLPIIHVMRCCCQTRLACTKPYVLRFMCATNRPPRRGRLP